MKNNLVCLLCVITLFFSCSPAYKTSQTPDDVYYSPGKKILVQDRYDTYESSDDYYLRMKAKDYNKWSDLDDYSYWYDSRYYANNWSSPYTSYFSLSLGYGFGSYPYYSTYNPYWYNSWGSWYNPCYTVVYYKNPTVYYKPIRNNSNLSGYNNRNYNNYNMPLQNDNHSRAYNNSSMMNANGKNTYYNSNQNNTNSNPVRTFNNSSSSSSSMSSGSRISGGGTRTRP